MKHQSRFFAIALLGFVITSISFADDDKPTPEERAYKFRAGLFQTFAWKYGQLIAAQKQDDAAAFSKHAADLQSLSTLTEEGFQIKDSIPEGSASKPGIWQDYETFKEKAESLTSMANALTQPGAMKDFNAKEFGSKACGSCHRDFKVKKD